MNAVVGKVDKKFNLVFVPVLNKGELGYLGKVLLNNFKKEDQVDELLVGELSEIKPEGAFKIEKMGKVNSGNTKDLMNFIKDFNTDNVYIFDTSIDVWLYYNDIAHEFDPLRTVIKPNYNKEKSSYKSRDTKRTFRQND